MLSWLNMKSCVLSLFIVVFLYAVRSQQTAYNGPESIEYFQTYLNSDTSDVANLMRLTCLDESAVLGMFDINITDGLNNYFGETNDTKPVQYYKLNITSKMKQLYKSSLSISTCCDLHICETIDEIESDDLNLQECNAYLMYLHHYAFEVAMGKQVFFNSSKVDYEIYESFCGQGSSLDTFIYILQEKKGQLNLIQTNDDSSSCTNLEKSYVNLMDYPEGEYIIAVGGYGKEYGSYYLRLSCVHYSYPITEDQFDPPSNAPLLTCGTLFQNETLNETHPVKYYSMSIDPTKTYLPFTIFTEANIYHSDLPQSFSYVSMYIIKLMQHELHDQDDYKYDFVDFADAMFIINDTSTLYGSYYLAVQGVGNQPGTYTISMECSPPPTSEPTMEPTGYPSSPPSVAPTARPEQVNSIAVTLSVFGSATILLILFGIYYVYKWRQYYANKRRSSTFNPITDLTDNDDNEEKKDEQRSDLEQGMKIKGVSIRRLDLDKSVNDQLDDDTDVVQAVLSHAIQCCEDHNGFDIYQVTAIRYYERDSRKIRGVKPFEKIVGAGINVECIRFSPLAEAALKALIVALTQIWGITVVVYKLIVAYFGETFQCDMDKQRWEEVWSLKVLSFLLSLVVTFFIGIMISSIQHNGLYLILDKLLLKHMKRIDNIALWIVQVGQTVNYYVCLWAVIGSYFVILEANEGDKNDENGTIDYSQAGLELILNGIALFFMLELDDMLVWEQDYVDCGEHLKIVLANYKPDTRINSIYAEDFGGLIEDDEEEENENLEMMENRNDGCIGYMVPILYGLNGGVSILVRVVCYVGGFAAPFIIFFCW